MTTIATIQQAVASAFEISPVDLTGRCRARRFAVPRQVAMYLARALTQNSLVAIGRHFGSRHHTTVLHACHHVGDLIRVDPTFAERVSDIAATLREVAA